MHFKTEIWLQNMQIYASLYHKCNFPPSSRVSLQECWEKYFKCNITPSLRAFPYCSNLRHFSASFNIVRKRGSRHSHR